MSVGNIYSRSIGVYRSKNISSLTPFKDSVMVDNIVYLWGIVQLMNGQQAMF
jgi:hypothetical protein